MWRHLTIELWSARQIEGTVLALNDLSVLVAPAFLDSDVLTFQLRVSALHDKVDDDPSSQKTQISVSLFSRTLDSGRKKREGHRGRSYWTQSAYQQARPA
jgi:hypothetical protein